MTKSSDLKKLAEDLQRSLDTHRAEKWQPKVLGMTEDGEKLVSTLDWLRLRNENIEGWDGGEAVAIAHETYRAVQVFADEQRRGLIEHVESQKASGKSTAERIVEYVRANPRGVKPKTLYVEDVAGACGVSPRTVYNALKAAGMTT
ncbi:hypothetical protein [Aliiroseovarius sp.]|uniref:hypothetical protein n=1 Tax=Aliiroseovarius sp. TaxID=1872442 RepID=UPI00263688B0|nr:hypothetical protein [Aliiroseovarius sp.]